MRLLTGIRIMEGGPRALSNVLAQSLDGIYIHGERTAALCSIPSHIEDTQTYVVTDYMPFAMLNTTVSMTPNLVAQVNISGTHSRDNLYETV